MIFIFRHIMGETIFQTPGRGGQTVFWVKKNKLGCFVMTKKHLTTLAGKKKFGLVTPPPLNSWSQDPIVSQLFGFFFHLQLFPHQLSTETYISSSMIYEHFNDQTIKNTECTINVYHTYILTISSVIFSYWYEYCPFLSQIN